MKNRIVETIHAPIKTRPYLGGRKVTPPPAPPPYGRVIVSRDQLIIHLFRGTFPLFNIGDLIIEAREA